MTAAETRQKNVKAATTSIVVTAILLVILKFFLFFSSIQPEGCCGPGNTNVGMEVNLGDSETGSGDVQPMEPVGNEQPQQDEPEAAQSPEQNNQTETQQQPTPSEPDQSKGADEEPVVTSKEDSPVEVKEKDTKKEVKPVEKKEVEKKKEPETKPIEKKVEPTTEKAVVQEKKQTAADVNAVYKPGTKSTTDGTASGKEGKAGSEGNDKSGEGDKGVPGGTPGAAVYQGTPGGGNGQPTLALNGWDWDYIPKPKITESETGRITFEIQVDADGNVSSIKKKSGSLSAAAEAACKKSIENLTFTKKAGATVPPNTTGTITFVVRAE